MIPVTRLDGSVMVVNDEQIAWIETRPDTVISMMNGEKLLVREAPGTLVERTRDFKRSLLERPHLHVEWRNPAGPGKTEVPASIERIDAGRPDMEGVDA